MITTTSIMIFKTPRTFCNRSPQLSAVPCSNRQNVIHAKPARRSCQWVGSMLKARKVYSPKTIEVEAAPPVYMSKLMHSIVKALVCYLIVQHWQHIRG
jgi:hypothetical protein